MPNNDPSNDFTEVSDGKLQQARTGDHPAPVLDGAMGRHEGEGDHAGTDGADHLQQQGGDAEGADGRDAPQRKVFYRGDPVRTIKGARFTGVIVASFPNLAGKKRVVIEAVHPDFEESLHVYPVEQVEKIE